MIWAVKNHEWLSSLPIAETSEKQGQAVVGSILTPRFSSKKTHDKTLDELVLVMDISLAGKKPSIPSMEKLESLIKEICINE